jgi:hypothetical protein
LGRRRRKNIMQREREREKSTKGNEKVSDVLILIQYMESIKQWEEINESYIKVNENVG